MDFVYVFIRRLQKSLFGHMLVEETMPKFSNHDDDDAHLCALDLLSSASLQNRQKKIEYPPPRVDGN